MTPFDSTGLLPRLWLLRFMVFLLLNPEPICPQTPTPGCPCVLTLSSTWSSCSFVFSVLYSFSNLQVQKQTTCYHCTHVKVYLHEGKTNAKANYFLWSLSLLSINTELESLWTLMEAISFLCQYLKRGNWVQISLNQNHTTSATYCQ